MSLSRQKPSDKSVIFVSVTVLLSKFKKEKNDKKTFHHVAWPVYLCHQLFVYVKMPVDAFQKKIIK